MLSEQLTRISQCLFISAGRHRQRIQEEAHEVERRSSICPVGWYSVGEKCIQWTLDNKLRWYGAFDDCQYLGAELVKRIVMNHRC